MELNIVPRDADDVPDAAPESTADLLLCQAPGCTAELEYGGRGRKPKYCPAHKTSRVSNAARVPTGKDTALAKQAATTLAQVNSLLALGLHFVPPPNGLPATSAAIIASNDAFEAAVTEALVSDPKLARAIANGGAVSGKASLIIAYVMLAASVVPVARDELRELRNADRA